MQNLTLIDIRASPLACVLFAVFAVSPGYVIGRLTNVFSFRQRLLRTRLLLSIALSLAVSPAAAYWIGRAGAMLAIWAAALPATAVMGVFVLWDWRHSERRQGRIPAIALDAAAAWAIIAIGSLVDIQLLGRRTIATRRAYEESILSRDAILQFNPMNEAGGYIYGKYAHWQTVAYGPTCGSEFGGSPADCVSLLPTVAVMFRDSKQSSPANITALVFHDTDPLWSDRKSWIWKEKPLVANAFVRIMDASKDDLTTPGDAIKR